MEKPPSLPKYMSTKLLLLAPRENLFHNFERKFDPPVGCLVIDPFPKLRHHVKWVVNVTGGDENMRVEKVKRFSARRSDREDCFYAPRPYAEDSACFGICDCSFIQRSADEPQKRMAQTVPADNVLVRSAFGLLVFLCLAVLYLQVLIFEALVEGFPGAFADHAGPK